MFSDDLKSVPPRASDDTVNVFVETPKGSRHKYDIDDKGLVKIALELPEGVTFPFSFGFVPNTLAPEHQVARLQRELYRERRIMENEDASSGPTNATRRKRRSTNIGHRFGSGRGPLVLKATLHHGDVNTAVGF